MKDEVEYTLGRTVYPLRDDLLRNLFSFEPELEQTSSQNVEDSIREQKDQCFEELLQMDPKNMIDQVDDEFLVEEYDEYFLEKAEDIWRLLNTGYSEHFEPELVEQPLNLNLNLRDLHSNIKFYIRSEEVDENESAYYEIRGGKRIVSSAKETIKYKNMGFSTPPRK